MIFKKLALLFISLIIISCNDDEGINIGGNNNNNVIEDERLTAFVGLGEGEPSDFSDVSLAFEDSKGRQWLGLWEGGFYLKDGENITFYDTKDLTGDDDFGGNTRAFAEGPDGTIYIGDGGGLLVWEEGDSQPKKHSSVFGENGTYEVFSKNGKVYLGTYNGFLGIIDESGNLEVNQIPEEIDGKEINGYINDIDVSEDGTVWLAGRFTVARFDSNDFTFWNIQDVTGKNEIERENYEMRTVAIDGFGRPWIANVPGFIKTYYFDGSSWQIGHDFNTDSVTTKVYKHYFNNNEYWIASDNGGIYRYNANNDLLDNWTIENSALPDNDVYNLFFTDTKVYFGTNFFDRGGWGYIDRTKLD